MTTEQEIAWLRTTLGAAQHRINQLEAKLIAADWLAETSQAYLELAEQFGEDHASLRAALDAYRRSPK